MMMRKPSVALVYIFSAIKAHGIKLDFDYKSHDPIPLLKFLGKANIMD